MLGHVLGGSVFAFATMLASFLLGIAIGAAVAARLSHQPQTAKVGFIYAQCATAVLALISWYGIESLAGFFNGIAQSEQTTWVPRSPVAIFILLPPAVTIGMTFPFAIRVHARDPSDAAGSSAKIYACNTLGGVLGALVTGTICCRPQATSGRRQLQCS
jgi:predicted membrane-bound spermidine synthase